jgi:hypothetical protein
MPSVPTRKRSRTLRDLGRQHGRDLAERIILQIREEGMTAAEATTLFF